MTDFAKLFYDFVRDERDNPNGPLRDDEIRDSVQVYHVSEIEALKIHEAALTASERAMQVIGEEFDKLPPKLQTNCLPLFINSAHAMLEMIIPLIQLGMQGGNSTDLGMKPGCPCEGCKKTNAIMHAAANVSTHVHPLRQTTKH